MCLSEQNGANIKKYSCGTRSNILGAIIYGYDSLEFIWNVLFLKNNMNKYHLNK